MLSSFEIHLATKTNKNEKSNLVELFLKNFYAGFRNNLAGDNKK